MSRKICLFAVVLMAAAIGLTGLTPTANAQCTGVYPGCAHYVGVGSSAMFNGFGVAAYNDLVLAHTLTAAPHCPAGDTCTPKHWSQKSSAAAPIYCKDTRVSGGTSPVNQTGNIWIDWVEVTAGPDTGTVTDAWTYLSVDSTVGVRCFLAKPTPTLIVSVAAGTAGANLVSPVVGVVCPLFTDTSCDSPLTAAVLGALLQPAGIAFTAGMTDIRPEDALLATQRILGNGTACGGFDTDTILSNFPCIFSFALGYDVAATPGIGTGIFSGTTAGSFAQPVTFALPGFADPLSGVAVPGTIRTVAIGEAPIIFVTNRSNVATGLGAPIPGYNAVGNTNPEWAGQGFPNPADNTGQPAGYVSDGSYYVRNVWDQHPWPMVNNIYPALQATVTAGDPSGNGFCYNGNPECHMTRRPLGNLFSGGDCETDNSSFTWPLAPGNTQGLRATVPGGPGGLVKPITVFLREPLSGTYNTTEFTEMRRFGTPGGSMGSAGVSGFAVPAPLENLLYNAAETFERRPYISQETGIDPKLGPGIGAPPPGTSNNGLNLKCGANYGELVGTQEGSRIRAIGTGQVTGGVSATADSIGYLFFSFGNAASLSLNKNFGYLMVDAIDPIFDNYENATPGSAVKPLVTTANGLGYPAPWGNGSGVGFNVEGEPACEGSGLPSIGCPFSLAYPATQEPGQPANNALYPALAGPTGWGVLPACNGAGQPVCTAAAIWHTPTFGVDDSVNCPGGFPCTYPHLRDGSYPAWSELRLLCDTANPTCTSAGDPLGAEALVSNLQHDIHFSATSAASGKGFGVPDLLPFDFANPAAPYGDAYYIRDHYSFVAANDNAEGAAIAPFQTCNNDTTHQSNVVVSFGGAGIFGCPTANLPVNGPPTAECGGDAGGYIRAATPANYSPFYGATGAFAPGCGTGFPGDLQ